ncbi:MAG TPA: aminotransferase class V-fold PLP-dependent enzyme [Thermoleophilaceae bacterium]|nr:aminotransferase class V-fold PLP-dependent enzyme [Thermoleophilaceae bacterium]
MSDPLDRRDELESALELAAAEARVYLEGLADDPVQPPGSAALLEDAGGDRSGRAPAGDGSGGSRVGDGSLPQRGDGAVPAVAELARLCREAATRSSGPRFFHFVIGGTTPAALAADWLTSAIDQNVAAWIASPLGTRLEQVAIDWLRQLFRLPPEFGGVLVTGGTMANFTCLAAAREWCAEQAGFSAAEEGLSGAPPIRVLTSGYVHASAMKSLALLGIGRANVRKLTRDAGGRLDVEALADGLATLDGGPAIVIANAGEVNAGDFDPIEEMAELAERHGAWLHVDGAFGLFARLSPRTEALTAGSERASSVSSDGHKWLNVPHDCGFAFVREDRWRRGAFSEQADYLPPLDSPRPVFAYHAPEGSRRARALTVWATLRAYGAEGYREMVERHLDVAAHLAGRIDSEPVFERLAAAPLNIVCFRWRPPGVPEERLDDLNRRLGEALLEDGRVFAGTTLFEGRVAFRPAIVNWQTRTEDVDVLVEVLLELAARLLEGEPAPA